MIYAKDLRFWEKPNAANATFFDNLGWNYFDIQPSADGAKLVVQTVGDAQKSTLDTRGISQLFKKNFNTEYIIHPDEIIADNFAIVVLSAKNTAILNGFTEGGKTLIGKMREVLTR